MLYGLRVQVISIYGNVHSLIARRTPTYLWKGVRNNVWVHYFTWQGWDSSVDMAYVFTSI